MECNDDVRGEESPECIDDVSREDIIPTLSTYIKETLSWLNIFPTESSEDETTKQLYQTFVRGVIEDLTKPTYHNKTISYAIKDLGLLLSRIVFGMPLFYVVLNALDSLCKAAFVFVSLPDSIHEEASVCEEIGPFPPINKHRVRKNRTSGPQRKPMKRHSRRSY